MQVPIATYDCTTSTAGAATLSADVVELRSGGVVAQIEPTEGGRIVSLIVGGVERILPKASARAISPPLYWGCYPMVPWAGRLASGRIPTDDGEVRLEPNLPPSAIHGLGFDKPWAILEQSELVVTTACELHGLGWPFGGMAWQTLRLSPARLELELEVGEYTRSQIDRPSSNLGPAACQGTTSARQSGTRPG